MLISTIHKDTHTTYELHPSIWRAMRRKNSGCFEVVFRDKYGCFLFWGHLSRYRCLVIVPTNRFREISWKQTVKNLLVVEPSKQNGYLGYNDIAIGISHY